MNPVIEHDQRLAKRRERYAAFTPEQREAHLAKRRQAYALNPEVGRESSKRYRKLHPEKVGASDRRHRLKYREQRKRSSRSWYERNKEQQRAYRLLRREKDKQWRCDNADRIRVRRRQWHSKNRSARNEYRRNYVRVRKQIDPLFKVLGNLRSRLNECVRRKRQSTMDLLGCSMSDFRIYIESKFESGMSWENYGRGNGKWNLDHIIPCALFDFNNADHIKRCFHFSNLQPLWEIDNLKKDVVT